MESNNLDVEEKIEKFIAYFRSQLTAIQKINISKSEYKELRLYKKILFITLIDCLAGIKSEKKLNNNQRFIGFVKTLNCWPDGDRISAPFLFSNLEKNKLYGQLLEKIRNHLGTFKPDNGNMISLTGMDFLCDELLPLVKCKEEKKAIDQVSHWTLLYKYRNFLIHEFREPGYGIEMGSEESPFYHGYINDNNFYLAYPVNFFENIAKNAIKGIENYFHQKKIDPYSRVTDTSRWYKKN